MQDVLASGPFPPNTLFLNQVAVLPAGALNKKSGTLSGPSVRQQRASSMEVTGEAMGSHAAALYLSMGVEPTSCVIGAATRAVLGGKTATAHNMSVLDTTDIVNGLATLIGAVLGFGSEVDWGDLGMCRANSGAGTSIVVERHGGGGGGTGWC